MQSIRIMRLEIKLWDRHMAEENPEHSVICQERRISSLRLEINWYGVCLTINDES